jgi:hypothetical protein
MASNISVMTSSHCRLASANLLLLLQAALLPQALAGGGIAAITASGTVEATASVELPTQQITNPPVIATDGSSMSVANAEPVTLSATVPSLVALSPLQLTSPSGVDSSSVAANITLRRPNGALLVGTSTSGGGSQPFGVGKVDASVNASFYSITDQPLPPGTYIATTTLSIVAE